jgi:hypothetical protein
MSSKVALKHMRSPSSEIYGGFRVFNLHFLKSVVLLLDVMYLKIVEPAAQGRRRNIECNRWPRHVSWRRGVAWLMLGPRNCLDQAFCTFF